MFYDPNWIVIQILPDTGICGYNSRPCIEQSHNIYLFFKPLLYWRGSNAIASRATVNTRDRDARTCTALSDKDENVCRYEFS